MRKHFLATAVTAAALALCGLAPATAASADACGVNPHDGKLYCTSNEGAVLFHQPRPVDAVDYLDTTESWFTCWTRGEPHPGGNTTWYGTVGNRFGAFGYVAASEVHTPSSFDADPGRYGLRHC